MQKDSRSWLEAKGWLQGSFVCPEDMKFFKDKFSQIPKEDNIYLITASQSCDVCGLMDREPYIEFSIAKKLENFDGNLLHNKNPRKLHLEAQDMTNGEILQSYFELVAYEKIIIEKSDIQAYKEIEPYEGFSLTTKTIDNFANWLAGRYNRPALPNAFERRLSDQWSKKKQAKQSGKVGENLIGIYVDLNTYDELADDKPYKVDLLFMVMEVSLAKPEVMEEISKLNQLYIENMQEAGFEIKTNKISSENKVSVKIFRTYKRLPYLDELSYKDNLPLPVEINNPPIQ